MTETLLILTPFIAWIVLAIWLLFGNELRKPVARYRVKRMLAHSIPGFPSPCAVRGSVYCLTKRGADSAQKRMFNETSDGRGVYYGEIENYNQN